MNFRSIHFRLIFWYSCLVIIITITFGAYTYNGLKSHLYKTLEETLIHRADQIRSNILSDYPNVKPAEISKQIEMVYTPEANNRIIRVLKENGEVFYSSGTLKEGNINPLNLPLPATNSNVVGKRIERVNNIELFLVTVPAYIYDNKFIIEMGASTESIDTALSGLVTTFAFGLPLLIIIAAGGGYFLIYRALKPVEDIRAAAEKITFGNLSNRLPVPNTGDELEQLSATLNQMLERLDSAYQQASRFSGDASHELRTPLTIMRGELESMVMGDSLNEQQKEHIGSILEETERLVRITEGLISIARLNAGEAKIEDVKFDLSALVKATAEQMLLLAEEKNITIDINAPDRVEIVGDPARIKQVIVNLLDNAIKYTPENKAIAVSVSAESNYAKMKIKDNGIGIPEAALPHIFDRFYRADKVRSREMGGGAGLGLSIVHSICMAHGGKIDVKSVEKIGTIITVELPLANSKKGQEN